MGKIIAVLFMFSILFSCKKDKVTICEGVSMYGERARFVGTWRWYSTRMLEWFDIGSDYIFYYTPQTQGFDYYFTLSSDGRYLGYKDNVLVDDMILNEVTVENLQSNTVNVIAFKTNCSEELIGFNQYITNSTNDSIYQKNIPIDIYDEENRIRSVRSYFVKE